MGIFGALNTAVAGLRAQSYSLENISGNIANSQTAGFKRIDTSFVDLVSDRPKAQAVSGSVSAFARQTNTLQGDLLPTGIATNMALNGAGFFAVQQRTGYSDNRPIFDSIDLFTRRGDFFLDKDGYLVNGAGYFLKGASINPATGVVSSANGVIRLSEEAVPANATEEISYQAILPSRPSTNESRPDVPDSELLGNGFADPNSITGAERSAFLNRSINGGSIIIYNNIGNPIDVQLRWAKLTSDSNDEQWNLYFQTDSQAGDTDPMWVAMGTPVIFNSDGALRPDQVPPDPLVPASPTSYTFGATQSIDGVGVGGVMINFGQSGLKQFANPNGTIQGVTMQQDGYAAGILDSLSVASDGRISGLYTNGRVLPIGQVAIVQFNAPNQLKRRDGGAFEQTLESGIPLGNANGTTVVGGSIEQSNTDIADEFSKMIVAQQSYSANTRVVTTAQQMMEAAINMVR